MKYESVFSAKGAQNIISRINNLTKES